MRIRSSVHPSVDPFVRRALASRRERHVCDAPPCSRCMPQRARVRWCASGVAERPSPMRHAPSLSTQKAAETRRSGGGSRAPCSGAGCSKRVGGHAARAAAAHGEREGGSDPSGGEPSRDRLASLHETRACKSQLQGDQPSASPSAVLPALMGRCRWVACVLDKLGPSRPNPLAASSLGIATTATPPGDVRR